MSTVLSQSVHKSQWGYHPYDYDTHLKLKEAVRLLGKAYRQQRAHQRWAAKDPQNRVRKSPAGLVQVQEPKQPTVCLNLVMTLQTALGTIVFRNLFHYLLFVYSDGRRAKPSPQLVLNFEFPEWLDELMDNLKKYYTA